MGEAGAGGEYGTLWNTETREGWWEKGLRREKVGRGLADPPKDSNFIPNGIKTLGGAVLSFLPGA